MANLFNNLKVSGMPMVSSVISFARHLNIDVISGDGVYLTSERSGHSRIQGELIERLTPLLVGGYERDFIVAELSSDFGISQIQTVLDRLIAAGKVVIADPSDNMGAAGFWEASGADGGHALQILRDSTVQLICLGRGQEDFETAASSLDLSISRDLGDLAVVLVDDYLDPRLDKFNREALSTGKPWMLARTSGITSWIGPVFEPNYSACWQCLATRIESNQMVQLYLRQHEGSRVSYSASSELPATRAIGSHLAALHVARWLTGSGRAEPATAGPDAAFGFARTKLVTVDTIDTVVKNHMVTRRPQCQVCGEGKLQSRLQNSPIALVSRPKIDTADGGHRAKSPESLLKEYEPLVSPISGPVKELTRTSMAVDGLYAYVSGQNFAVPMAGITDLRATLRSASAGKGMSDVQARASAIGEAIERASGIYRGDEARIEASYLELGSESAIAPNELHQFSNAQFAARREWNSRGSHFQRVCDPFDTSQSIDWTPVWSLSRERFKYMPTASLFYGYSLPFGGVYSGADSNGNAAGTCLEDAIIQGFMELVERDSVAIWWYNMLRQPRVDLDSFSVPYFDGWQKRYRSLGRETWILDLTTDLGVPAVVAVSRRIDKPVEDILIAFGAHFDIEVAISRAMSEMNQFLPSVVNVQDGFEGTGASGDYTYPAAEHQKWWMTATLENQPYLVPEEGSVRVAKDYVDRSTADLSEDVHIARRIVENAGMEMLVLDQTRPDYGLPVVKVLVPGMRHFWARYAPGRLYDVPVAMNRLLKPTSEDQLNPIAMFL